MGVQPTSTTLYERFLPAERLVLLLEAMARSDEAEIERVRRTCPRRTYSQIDAAFEDRYEMLLDATVVACGDLKGYVAQLRLLDWARVWIRRICTCHTVNASLAFVDGDRYAKGLPQSPFFKRAVKARMRSEENEEESLDETNEEDSSKPDQEFCRRIGAVERRAERFTRELMWMLRRLEMDLARQMNNTWTAYESFCQTRIGLSAQRLLEAYGYPGREDLAEYLERYKEVALDENAVAEYRDGLCGFWDRRFEEGNNQ